MKTPTYEKTIEQLLKHFDTVMMCFFRSVDMEVNSKSVMETLSRGSNDPFTSRWTEEETFSQSNLKTLKTSNEMMKTQNILHEHLHLGG